jgi:ferrous iron transport protein A
MLSAFAAFTGNAKPGADVGQLDAPVTADIADLLISNLAADAHVHDGSSLTRRSLNVNENDCQQHLILLPLYSMKTPVRPAFWRRSVSLPPAVGTSQTVMSRTTLARTSTGDSCLVLDIQPEPAELKARLYALGVIPGSSVRVMRLAPLGDPMQIRVGGSYISIRKAEAEAIQVEVQ